MKILSIYPYTHISSAAYLDNGKIISAAAEERFSREKYSVKFPNKTISWILKKNKIKFSDIDLITIPWNPAINLKDVSSRWIDTMRWRGEMLPNIFGNLLRNYENDVPKNIILEFNNNKIIFLDHHECHAASSFFNSGFKNSHILTIDGHGENETCFFGSGRANKIKKHHNIKYPHSIGLFYGTFTDFLGFTPDRDEWKVMALSSYSNKKNIFDKKIEKLFSLTKNGFELNLSYFDFYHFDRQKHFFNEKLISLLGPNRAREDKITQRHYMIASAMQRKFDEIVTHLIKVLKNKSNIKTDNLCLAGGAALNCVFNGNLHRKKIYKNIFIPPFPDDIGVSVGGAILGHSRLNKSKNRFINKRLKHNYWGPEFKNAEIEKILKNNKLKYEKLNDKNLSKIVAQNLANGKLIGWFKGKMEFGHRALGNRSILADPRSRNVKNVINKAIKFREGFRPFAPVCMREKASMIFEIPKNENFDFMEKIAFVRKGWIKKIPGVTHVDNSARLQTVTADQNKKLYQLLTDFNEITKVPVLVNTSFNLNGEPICLSPKDAIRSFFSCGLDILVLENFIIKKNDYKH